MSAAVRVKICGITSREDGALALAAGADALGFVLAERSTRRVVPLAASALVGALRAGADRPFLAVAVIESLDPADAREAVAGLGFDRVQIHPGGDAGVPELRESLEAFDVAGAPACGPGPATARAWGALRVKGAASLDGAETLPCEAVLVDAWHASAAGGTGRTFEWGHAVELARKRKLVLAGGLTPENVGAAIDAVRPWMVDVSSGVESAPGRKDPARVRAFVEAVRRHG